MNECMYVCKFAYIYDVSMYVYMYICMYVCMYVCKYVCKYVCIPPNSFRLEISPIRSYYARVYLCKYV